MTEQTEKHEVVCVQTTFDESDYFAGKTYAVTADVLQRYPDSFKRKEELAKVAEVKAEGAAKIAAIQEEAQKRYERVSDESTLRAEESEIERARQRAALKKQIAQLKATEQPGSQSETAANWKAKPPQPQSEARNPQLTDKRGPMARAERMKQAGK